MWQIWIDRGGTFTDLVARKPNGELISHKLLSENPEQYEDAALQGVRDMLGLDKNDTTDGVNATNAGGDMMGNFMEMSIDEAVEKQMGVFQYVAADLKKDRDFVTLACALDVIVSVVACVRAALPGRATLMVGGG